MAVVSRRCVCVESMGVASGCGYKEVYRFPHNYYCLASIHYINSFVYTCMRICAHMRMHTRTHTHITCVAISRERDCVFSTVMR